MMDKTAIGEAIRAHRKARGLTIVDMEKRTGINNGNLSKIERGLQGLTPATMTTIAQALGLSLSDLFKETEYAGDKIDSRKIKKAYSGHRVTDFSELKLIPEGINVVIESVRAAPQGVSVGGTMRGWEKDPAAVITFLSDCLRDLDAQPANLVAHRVKDDTMQPRLYPGDSVVIDTGDTNVPADGGVFAIIIDTRTVSVRRLFYPPGGGLHMTCDNDRYPTVTLSAEEAKSVVIVGRLKVLQSNFGL